MALVTLGGAGHEPALSGFVGEGMLDISVVGDIFAAPGPPAVFEALKQADREAGTLFVVLNHAGDVLSADMALQMAEAEGLKIMKVLTHEDIAAGPDAPEADKRGLVGCVPLYKIAGAAAEAGKSLEEVHAIAERFNDNMATLAVAMKAATHPATGETLFELADDEMEIGMGQHGEAGTGPCKVRTADDTAALMMERLVNAIGAKSGDRLMVILNGAGSDHPDGTLHRAQRGEEIPRRAGHRDRRDPGRRDADRPGNGRIPDVRREDGRRADRALERAVQHAVVDGAVNSIPIRDERHHSHR